ncbi:nitronate monooxygenase family protein [Alteribacillus sp. YIM 98480]|uniref:NAD(P)H-dependent flavin oxidoreductase n=1 Tax=Alteribacillus sp. YIM 98480 TaxID=2606599 RepID=UPI001E5161F7|nr:nitronate monooxygenase [Alteribacillus sp. YIM 98480]
MNKSRLYSEISNKMSLPVIMAPMFLVSNPETVIKGCTSGIIGSFPALNARTGDILADWMTEIKAEIEKAKNENPAGNIAPWAVNFISHKNHNKRYDEDLKLIEQYQPPIVITSLGDPKPVVDIVHQYGGLVFADVINIFFAKKAADKGVDGLILVCNGAGGHAGTYHPMAFLKEVKQFFNGITVLAGSISDGRDVLAAEVMGADFAYIGTKFIAAAESSAPEEYQEMLVQSTMEDILYTDVFSGVNANYLKPSITQAGIDPKDIVDKKVTKHNVSEFSETKAWKDVWSAGHGVGSVTQIQTLQEMIEELKESYHSAFNELTVKQ